MGERFGAERLGAKRRRDEDEVVLAPTPLRPSGSRIDQMLFSRILKLALWHAKTLRCHVDQFLIRAGLFPEAQLYEALAERLGVPFIPFPVLLDPNIAPEDALISGLAPVDPRRNILPPDTPVFIYSPQGARFEWFIENEGNTITLPSARIGITTPSAFHASIRATFGERLANRASTKLIAQCHRASASSLPSMIWIALLAGLIGLVITSSVFTTTIWHGLLLILSCFPIIPGLIVKILSLQSDGPFAPTLDILTDEHLPSYSVLVPVYREAEILRDLISSLEGLDYPRSKLDIKLLIEADDVETLDALSHINLPPYFETIICPRGTPRTKPRALTIGLAYSKSDLIVVYDAEDVPEPDQLKKAASVFALSDKKVACLQARLTVDNLHDSWFTRQFALEYAALFDVLLPGLAALDQPIPLGGTSNHFRRLALEAVGAWDPWNVTEDADLGLRLYRAGYQVKTFHSTTHEEAPATYSAWINQRMRWLKGWMQTAAVHMRSHHHTRRTMSQSNWFSLLLAASLSPVCTLLHPMLLLIIDFAIAWVAHNPDNNMSQDMIRTGFAVMFIGSLYLDMLIIKRGSHLRAIKIRVSDLLSLIPYSLLKTYAGWRALIELLYAPFHWRKTRHGLARTSRLKTERRFKTIS